MPLLAAARGLARAGQLARWGAHCLSFLRFLAGRGRCLGEAGQEDLDAFFATARRPSGATDYFVFAIAHRRCRRLELPRRPRQCSPGTPLPALAPIVARPLDDEALELADRVAGMLVLLFTQSVTRVAALRVGAITCNDAEVAVNLGAHPVPLPAAVASIFSRYLERRVNTGTTNTATDFLFPGCRPGHHVAAFQLTKRMNALGITKAERQGALTTSSTRRPPPSSPRPPATRSAAPLPDRCCSDRTGQLRRTQVVRHEMSAGVAVRASSSRNAACSRLRGPRTMRL